MKSIVIYILLLNLFCAGADGGSKEQLPEFANVRYERGSLLFTTHATKWRMSGKLGNKGRYGRLPANSDLKIPLGEDSYFVIGRHQSLVIEALQGQKCLRIIRLTDLRSVRRGLKEQSFPLTVGADGSLTYGEVTTKMTYSGKGAEDKEDELRALAVPEPVPEKKAPDTMQEAAAQEPKPYPGATQDNPAESKSEKMDGDSAAPSPKWWWAVGLTGVAIAALLWRVLKTAGK